MWTGLGRGDLARAFRKFAATITADNNAREMGLQADLRRLTNAESVRDTDQAHEVRPAGSAGAQLCGECHFQEFVTVREPLVNSNSDQGASHG